MTAFDLARLAARQLRGEHVAPDSDGPTAVAAAAAALGFKIESVSPGDALIGTSDAKLLRDWSRIYVRKDVPDGDAAAYVAHEIGHLRLHRPQDACTGSDPDAGNSRALARVDSYGPRERRELQANVFGREFLLPRALAKRLFLDERKNAVEIAGLLKLPPALVRRQLFDSLLGPDVAEPKHGDGGRTAKPDQSQIDAAQFDGPALLLEAGPGSGKTRTLVMRVDHLLTNCEVAPDQILALTFSNKAAGEIAERIMLANAGAAAEMWTGTFHAFGLDLIRRYYDKLGLPAGVQLIDRAQAIELLEDRLPLMGLKHYHDLRYPEQALKTILGAISRAKDELVDAEEFARRADNSLAAAGSAEEIEAAERACEAARVYEIYTAALRDAGAVDFGDLVMLPTRLLIENEGIRQQVAGRHSHILVDEYQDVNRASARLLIELRREGAQLWVVGDARQSLYRWRGASSANMAGFEADFPGGKRLPLGRNYRSTDHIVTLGKAFAREMRAGRNGLAYDAEADREEPGTATRLLVGLDDACEGELVAQEIIRLREAGVRLGDQAVLAPTNARLDIAADILAHHGLATSHLGSFFEREEVRDLFAVLALLAEANGGALVRVAAMREVRVGAADIGAIVRRALDEGEPVVSLLCRASGIDGISASGGAALERLGAKLDGLTPYTPAFEAAASWLVDRSDYLRDLASAPGPAGASARAAILTLLTFLDQRELGGQPLTPARALKRMRSTMLLSDDRDLRSVTLGSDSDAVHLMTIHGAKGLEFPAVHVVGLHKNCLPGTFRRDACPLPPGLIVPETRETHLEEEECLFFVAISRAEDHLRLYHSEKANVQTRQPSPFLARLGPLDRQHLGKPSIAISPVASPPAAITTDAINLFDMRDHEKCPLKIAYRRYFGIPGRRHESPFLKTSGVLYQLVDRVAEVAGSTVESGIAQLLDEIWIDRGPTDHGLAADYRDHADRQAATLVQLATGYDAVDFKRIELPITGGSIHIGAPLVKQSASGTEIRFLDAGRRRSKSGEDASAGLLLSAARHAFGANAVVSIGYVTGGDVVPVTRDAAKSAGDVEAAAKVLAAINSGVLPPRPTAHNCGRCPYFVGCPAVGAPEPC
jgi:superfamily I DNA/RNA helicase